MTFHDSLAFAKDFALVPRFSSITQLQDLFAAVNSSPECVCCPRLCSGVFTTCAACPRDVCLLLCLLLWRVFARSVYSADAKVDVMSETEFVEFLSRFSLRFTPP